MLIILQLCNPWNTVRTSDVDRRNYSSGSSAERVYWCYNIRSLSLEIIQYYMMETTYSLCLGSNVIMFIIAYQCFFCPYLCKNPFSAHSPFCFTFKEIKFILILHTHSHRNLKNIPHYTIRVARIQDFL